MNAAQARALGGLFDEIEQLTGRKDKDLYLGDSRHAVSVTATSEDEYDYGWQEITVWSGGRGVPLLLDPEGNLHADNDDECATPAKLTYKQDFRDPDRFVFGWVSP